MVRQYSSKSSLRFSPYLRRALSCLKDDFDVLFLYGLLFEFICTVLSRFNFVFIIFKLHESEVLCYENLRLKKNVTKLYKCDNHKTFLSPLTQLGLPYFACVSIHFQTLKKPQMWETFLLDANEQQFRQHYKPFGMIYVRSLKPVSCFGKFLCRPLNCSSSQPNNVTVYFFQILYLEHSRCSCMGL